MRDTKAAERAWKRFASSQPNEEKPIGSVRDAVVAGDAVTLNLKAPPWDGELPSIGIVLACTGWGAGEERAYRNAVKVVETQPKTSLVLVQNDGYSWNPVASLPKRGRIKTVCMRNDGFSAANNAGLEVLKPDTEWVLFTQQDAIWDASVLEFAIRYAMGVGSRLAVGPSGGRIMPSRMAFTEEGRNIKQTFPPRVSHFLAGYWVLAPCDAVRKIGGWDTGYFLYCEDPDLCLRLSRDAHIPSVVHPGIEVNHERSVTVRSVLNDEIRRSIHQFSLRRFAQRWTP